VGGENVRKTFKYRLKLKPEQEQTLNKWLGLCRQLYNSLLEQRQIAYEKGRRIGKYDQMRELTALRSEFPEYREINAQALGDVADRLDRAYQRFFRGGGFPKFQGKNRYESITFRQSGWKLVGTGLRISGCGGVKVRWSQPIQGNIKTVTIKRTKSGKWFVCFSCDNVPEPHYPPTDKAVGIDLGIEALATTSDGERIENGQYLKRKLRHLRRIQRHLARQKKGSNRRQKTVRLLARLHEKIANQRRDAHHKASTKLVRENAEIHMERIDPQFMIANKRLARAAHDVGWGQFKTFLQSKTATAGRKIVEKNPRNTSQECSGCGQLVPKKLSQRWHECDCGASLHRDHNAAIVILNRPA
jgi:putative transposase